MKSESNHTKFIQELLLNSNSNDYKQALLEWNLLYTITEENSCICGHPIQKNCILVNKYNRNKIVVGSSCVKKFFGRDYSDLFKMQNIIKRFYNLNLILTAKNSNVITEWEYRFLNSIVGFPRYSKKQEITFYKIHKKIMQSL